MIALLRRLGNMQFPSYSIFQVGPSTSVKFKYICHYVHHFYFILIVCVFFQLRSLVVLVGDAKSAECLGVPASKKVIGNGISKVTQKTSPCFHRLIFVAKMSMMN